MNKECEFCGSTDNVELYPFRSVLTPICFECAIKMTENVPALNENVLSAAMKELEKEKYSELERDQFAINFLKWVDKNGRHGHIWTAEQLLGQFKSKL